MSTHHRQQPSRLFIPPMLNSQLANQMDTRAMFSPALHTAHQPGFPPLPSAHPFSHGFPLQTPMQGSFFASQQTMPQRPMLLGHRQNGSMANVHGHGPLQPSVPMTPFGSQFPPQMLHGGAPSISGAQPFIPKSRRTPSMIGGPPKAALGGPNRKVSPLPPTAQAALLAEKLKSKKIPVKLPFETVDELPEGVQGSLWTRSPAAHQQDEVENPASPDTSTADIFPEEEYRVEPPPIIDICLPLPNCWEEMKQREIDEKLEKLGIERSRPDSALNAPRGRAASISSPADPALLLFKLNKLQQQQSASTSIATSPLPQLPSPGHGYSISVAAGASYHSPAFGGRGRLSGSVSPGAVGEDGARRSPINLHAPQGHIPAQLTVPSAPSRNDSRPDFIRGFGLDITEEEDEDEEVAEKGELGEEISKGANEANEDSAVTGDVTVVDPPRSLDDKAGPIHDGAEDSTSPVKTSMHLQHPSRVSVALSVGSRKNADEPLTTHSKHSSVAMTSRTGLMNNEVIALNEWTGSESVDVDAVSDSDSMDGWSNPSDEERERKEQAHAEHLRLLHLEMQKQEQPRRIPEFPRPPERVPVQDDDDIISNPSDEERQRASLCSRVYNDALYPSSGVDSSGRTGRPLPPVPHSREPSYEYSYYGSLPAHSREPSANQLARVVSPEPASATLQVPLQNSAPLPKKDLNPFAKPFVFGGKPTFTPSVPASVNSDAASSPVQTSAPGHSRNASYVSSKALNAAAQEFKPSGGFTFRAPEGVPQLTFPEPLSASELSRPLPQPPVVHDPRITQGREKRLKTSISDIENSSDFEFGGEGHDSMASFRFPITSDQATFAKSAPTSPGQTNPGRPTNMLSANSKPLTFSGYSNMPPVLPPLLPHEQRSLTDTLNAADFLSVNATRGSGFGDDTKSPDLTLPSIQKQKRAPIPLDFTHPVSTNKAPAGLFKNLASGSMENRSNRPYGGPYDYADDRSNPSLDDLSVPAISGAMSRRVIRPEDLDASEGSENEYVLNELREDGGESEERSAGSRPQSPPVKSYIQPEIASYSQGLRLEDRIETILSQKMDEIAEIVSSQRQEGAYVSGNTDELVREAMAMFRTQLRDSATKAMDDSTLDARGEIDVEMIKDIVEQGHADSRKRLQADLASLMRTVQEANSGQHLPYELASEVRELKSSLHASNNAIRHQLAALGESSRSQSQPLDRDGLVTDLLAALTPHLAAIRSEPIDYDGLTAQLSQAVKPHITQLIDLASDKRETAGLIVNQLTPYLESIQTGMSASDTRDLVAEITASVNRVIAPIDTYAIKEQVADLVVERLDARLHTRDSEVAVNFGEIKSRMTDQLAPLLSRFDLLDKVIQNMGLTQSETVANSRELSAKRDFSDRLLLDLSEKMSEVVKSRTTQNAPDVDAQLRQLSAVSEAIAALRSQQEQSTTGVEELMSLIREIYSKFINIPELVSSAMGSHESSQNELLAQLKALQASTQETRKLVSQNTDLQAQLNKARSQHGQIRVQVESANAKFDAKENECHELRAKIAELEAAAASREADFASLKDRSAEQERAMRAALDRLKASDVDAQTRQERLMQLEKDNRELSRRTMEQQSKIESLDMQATFASRDKENMQRSLRSIEEEHDRILAQQAQLDDLRRTSEQVENLAKLMARNDSEELAELRRVRDQSKTLQFEHDTLKKRFKEQEGKIATAERTSLSTRQSLEQAQKRAADWEEKARAFEAEVERLTTALDQAEQMKGQLDADYTLAKLQLEEKAAEDRIAKDRERKLAEEVANLKGQVKTLTSDLDAHRKASRDASKVRPTSRSSTTFEASEPPTPKMNGKTLPARTPTPKSNTWDSMHAPRTSRVAYMGRPVIHSQRSSYYGSRAASPAPSAVSTVTRDGDGWFS